MLNGLPRSEKEAFWGLLDEYFETRPHFLPAPAGQTTSPGFTTSANSGSGSSITINRDDMQRAGRFAATPMGQKVTGMAAGRALGNKALGNAAATMWAGQHRQQEQNAAQKSGTSRGPPPAAPSSALKPYGIAGLMSGKSFGGLSMGSNTAPGSAMPPRQLSSSRLGTTTAPAATAASVNSTRLPPPARTGPGVLPSAASSSPALAPAPSEPEVEGIGYAEALFDYGDASDPDDLVVVEGERIVLLESISADWWRASNASGDKAGIVPTVYVRQL